jgi:hypothetical protein
MDCLVRRQLTRYTAVSSGYSRCGPKLAANQRRLYSAALVLFSRRGVEDIKQASSARTHP